MINKVNLDGLHRELANLKQRRKNCSYSEISRLDSEIRELKDTIVREELIDEGIIEPDPES